MVKPRKQKPRPLRPFHGPSRLCFRTFWIYIPPLKWPSLYGFSTTCRVDSAMHLRSSFIPTKIIVFIVAVHGLLSIQCVMLHSSLHALLARLLNVNCVFECVLGWVGEGGGVRWGAGCGGGGGGVCVCVWVRYGLLLFSMVRPSIFVGYVDGGIRGWWGMGMGVGGGEVCVSGWGLGLDVGGGMRCVGCVGNGWGCVWSRVT